GRAGGGGAVRDVHRAVAVVRDDVGQRGHRADLPLSRAVDRLQLEDRRAGARVDGSTSQVIEARCADRPGPRTSSRVAHPAKVWSVRSIPMRYLRWLLPLAAL